MIVVPVETKPGLPRDHHHSAVGKPAFEPTRSAVARSERAPDRVRTGSLGVDRDPHPAEDRDSGAPGRPRLTRGGRRTHRGRRAGRSALRARCSSATRGGTPAPMRTTSASARSTPIRKRSASLSPATSFVRPRQRTGSPRRRRAWRRSSRRRTSPPRSRCHRRGAAPSLGGQFDRRETGLLQQDVEGLHAAIVVASSGAGGARGGGGETRRSASAAPGSRPSSSAASFATRARRMSEPPA